MAGEGMKYLILFILLAGCAGFQEVSSMEVYSPEFEDVIPSKYTCDGEDISPPIVVDGIPDRARSLALIVGDPDAPGGWFTHWVLFNVPITNKIGEGSVPEGATEGLNDFKKVGYGGPCPPSGSHRYRFRAYALDSDLDLDEGASQDEVERAMDGHVIAEAEFVASYSRR